LINDRVVRIIEKIEDKLSNMKQMPDVESKATDMIVDLVLLMMNLADSNCEDDPIVPFKNLS
jgi:hypothetical protein